MGVKRGLGKDLFPNSNIDAIEYCDSCDLCVRNSMIPSRGQGEVRSGAILHLVTAPSPADTKTKIIWSGNVGKYVRGILADKCLLKHSYITSVVKCGLFTDVTPNAIKACFPKLQKEIETVNPSIIVTYGKDPYYVIYGSVLPKNKPEGINVLANGVFHVYTISIEAMRKQNDYTYLDRAYGKVADIYNTYVNKWVAFK